MLTPFLVYLLTVILARGLVVLGLLILWRTGLMSFGQALYFGVGAYAVGLAEKYWGLRDAFALLALALAASAAMALVLGWLLRQYRDIYFAMLSLAFSMILYGTLVKSRVARAALTASRCRRRISSAGRRGRRWRCTRSCC